MYVYINIYVCLSVCLSACLPVCVYVCVCVCIQNRDTSSLPVVFVSTPYFCLISKFTSRKKDSIALEVSIAILIMATLTPMKGVMTILNTGYITQVQIVCMYIYISPHM